MTQNLQKAAKTLTQLHKQLNTLKTTNAPKQNGPTHKCPGPRTPGNTWAIDTSIELTERLFEYVRDAANHIQPERCFPHQAIPLLEWITFNAALIEPLGMHEDLLHEINTQTHYLNTHLQNTPHPHIENYLTARTIRLTLQHMGHTIKPKTLHTWANRGHITKNHNHKGEPTYLLSEVMNRIQPPPHIDH